MSLRYEADVEFLRKEEWEAQLRSMWDDLLDEGGEGRSWHTTSLHDCYNTFGYSNTVLAMVWSSA